MKLYLIEKAIRPQFSWLNHPTKKLQVYDKREGYAGLGVIVFIGIANSYNIPPADTINYLCIEPTEYNTKSKIFSDTWSVVQIRKGSQTLCKEYDATDRLYLKTKLTLNALNSQFHGQTLCSSLTI